MDPSSPAPPVEWQVASDPRFAHVVADGTARTGAQVGYSVRVPLSGLEAGREY